MYQNIQDLRRHGTYLRCIILWSVRSPWQIIHLERGTCSNINYIPLNKLAAECYKWPYFIFEDYRDELLDDGDTEYDCKPFSCPTCDTALSKLSSLFQHAESNACAQTLDDTDLGQLRRFLASRLS